VKALRRSLPSFLQGRFARRAALTALRGPVILRNPNARGEAVDKAAIAKLLLSAGAVELRTSEPFFTFASGISSPVYTDNRLLISDPDARLTIRDAFAEKVRELELGPEVIAGTATAGIPHAAFLADGMSLPMVYVRGSAKGHGKQNRIEGRLAPGAKVLLVEDLISTGGSSVSAAEALRDAGAEVIHVLAIFSYGFDSARDAFENAGFPWSSLVTFDEVIELARDDGRISAEEMNLLGRWSRDPATWPGGGGGGGGGGGAAEEKAVSSAEEALIVAADLPGRDEIEALAKQVSGAAGYLKLNSAFVAHGPELVAAVKALGLKVFLDLKFHDIPNTAANHCREAVRMGVGLLTVHASGGSGMMEACAAAVRDEASRRKCEAPKVLAVTALTSLSDEDLADAGVPGGRDAQVPRLAELARDAGVDGVVCSVAEAAAVRRACGGDFLIVTPGVRPAGAGADDHARSATPAEAVAAGADYIVVGRPVYGAGDPGGAAGDIAAEISAARENE